MNAESSLKSLFLVAVISMVLSCGNRANTPQMVQLCLGDDRDTDQLIGLLERTASEKQMKFINRSSASQSELKRLKKDPGYRVISVSASRQDGLGLAAGNLGLGAYEMAVGFTRGANAEESDKFIEGVITMLESKWHVRAVASDQGAMKSTGCGQRSPDEGA